MKRRSAFAVCINNRGYPASLEAGKLYGVIPDPEATKHGYVRVVDESGEDYAYSSERFFPLEIPKGLKRALRVAPANRALQRTADSRGRRRARGLSGTHLAPRGRR